MAVMLDLAEEFGFRIAAFHHGVEAYDGIRENIAFVDAPANGCAIVHSDSDVGIQRLPRWLP
jgi:hypothetical protein